MHLVEEEHMDHAHEVSPERQHQIVEHWTRQQEAYDTLAALADKSAEEIFGHEKLVEAFAHTPECVACVDERVKAKSKQQPKAAIAGTLILMNDEQRETTAERIAQNGITKVTFHGEDSAPCGACAAYCAAHGGGDPKEAGKTAAQWLIEKNNLSSEPEWAPYDEGADRDLHPARAIVVDGSGRFNPAVLDFPDAFQSSAWYYGHHDDYINKELDVIMGIVLGHGFGRWFEADSAGDQGSDPVKHEPLLVVLVGDPSQPTWSVEELQQRLQPTLSKYGHMIKTVSLSRPA